MALLAVEHVGSLESVPQARSALTVLTVILWVFAQKETS